MHWVLNVMKVSISTPSKVRPREVSKILIFGWVLLLACAGSGVNRVTVDIGADISVGSGTSLSALS